MRRVAAMAIKEVKQVLRDPLTLAMLIGLPMAMLILYGYALNFDVENVALAPFEPSALPEVSIGPTSADLRWRF